MGVVGRIDGMTVHSNDIRLYYMTAAKVYIVAHVSNLVLYFSSS